MSVNKFNRFGESTYHDYIAVEILSNINIALHDGIEGCDVDTTALKTQNAWLEECFGSSESLIANSDDLTVRKLVRLLQSGAPRGSLNLCLKVKCNIAQLLLDISDNFALGSGREGVAAFRQDLHEVVCQVTTSHVDSGNCVRKSETFVNRDNVGNTISRVEDNTSGTTGSVERQDGLDGDIEGGCVEGLEDDLCHLLSVGLGVYRGFGEEDWMLFRGDTQLIVEGVMPNLLHIIPVCDDTMFDWVPQSEDTSL